MNSKTRGFVVFLVVVVTAAWYFLLLRPTLADIATADERVEDFLVESDTLHARVQHLIQQQQDIASLEDELDARRRVVPMFAPSADLDVASLTDSAVRYHALDRQLLDVADATGVDVTSFAFSWPALPQEHAEDNPEIAALNVAVNVTGELDDIVSFIAATVDPAHVERGLVWRDVNLQHDPRIDHYSLNGVVRAYAALPPVDQKASKAKPDKATAAES